MELPPLEAHGWNILSPADRYFSSETTSSAVAAEIALRCNSHPDLVLALRLVLAEVGGGVKPSDSDSHLPPDIVSTIRYVLAKLPPE